MTNKLPAAVWAPDSCAMDEIDRRAAVYAWGKVIKRGYGDNKKYVAVADKDIELGEFDNWGDAFDRVEQEGKSIVTNEADMARGIERAAEELCENALDQYNAWANGDCWTVHSQRFELIDEQWVEVGESELCGGYVGEEWAEQELQERLHFNHWPEKEKAA